MKKILIPLLMGIALSSNAQIKENIVRMQSNSSPFYEQYYAKQLIRVVDDLHLYVLTDSTEIGQTMQYVFDNNLCDTLSPSTAYTATSPLSVATNDIHILPDSLADWRTKMNKGQTAYGWGNYQDYQINTLAPLHGGGRLNTELSLSMTKASEGDSGYLSKNDWNMFNEKVSSQWASHVGAPGAVPIYYTGGVVGIGTSDPAETLSVGSAAAGGNAKVYSTLGTEMAPALTTGNWTFNVSYWRYNTSPNTIEKFGTGTGTLIPTAATNIVAGVKYRVVIVISAMSVSAASYTLGGVPGTALSAAGTFTDDIIAGSTGKLIITPAASGLLMTITSISIKEMTNGNLKVSGDFLTSKIKSGSGVNTFFITPSGNVTLGATNAYNAAKFNLDGSFSQLNGPFTISSGNGGAVSFSSGGTTTLASYFSVLSTLTRTTAQNLFNLTPTVAQGTTAGYTGINLDVTETSLGSGYNALMNLQVGSVSKFNVLHNGRVGVNTTTPTNIFDVAGYARFRNKLWVGDSTGTYSYINPGDAAWTSSSSRTIKENITDIPVPDSLFHKVLAVSPKTYNFTLSNYLHDIQLSDICDSVPDIGTGDSTGQTVTVYRKLLSEEIYEKWLELVHADSLQAIQQATQVHSGFIAEEMSELTGGSEKEINYAKVTAVLWQTNQALIRKVEELEVRIKAIEDRLK